MATKRQRRIVVVWGFIGLILIGIGVFSVISLLGQRQAPVVVGQKVEGLTDELRRELPPGYPDVRFVDVSKEAGIHFVHSRGARTSVLPEDMGPGAAWGDYDGDGDLDLYVVNQPGPWEPNFVPTSDGPANALYRNNGDGTFTEVGAQAGVNLHVFGMGAAWGDYDGDGDIDLYVSNVGPNVLFRNDGNGTFTDVTEQAGVNNEGFGTTVGWADYDRDGDLDLYVANYVDFVFEPKDLESASEQFGFTLPFTINPSSYKPAKNCLYRNNGDGTFTNVAAELGVENSTGRSLSVTWADLDNDGWHDLYIANDISSSALYRNVEGQSFQDIGAIAWIAEYRGSMGLAVHDFDDDGDLDVFISHWVGQENSLYRNLLVEGGKQELHFTDIADMLGLGAIALPYVGWGTEFFDLDNDGRLDLLVVNGSTLQEPHDPTKMIPQRNFLFWNNGQEGFFDIGEIAGPFFTDPDVARGAAFADYDEDGDIDVFITRNYGPAVLLRNDTRTKNHWLTVRLHGPRGNPTGIGARVRLFLGDSKIYLREVGTSPSYLSQNSMDAHFGLGEATVVDKLVVTWSDGSSQQWEHVSADALIIATYGSNALLRRE